MNGTFLTPAAGLDYVINVATMSQDVSLPLSSFPLDFTITIIDDEDTERRESIFFDLTMELFGNVISTAPVEVVIFDNDPGIY